MCCLMQQCISAREFASRTAQVVMTGVIPGVIPKGYEINDPLLILPFAFLVGGLGCPDASEPNAHAVPLVDGVT